MERTKEEILLEVVKAQGEQIEAYEKLMTGLIELLKLLREPIVVVEPTKS